MIHVYEPVFAEEDAQAAADTVRSGILSAFGPEVKKLEKDFPQLIGDKYGLTCSSGTSALYLAMSPFIKTHDLVAVPTCSYAATAFSVLHHGATPVFVDADEKTWNMDLDKLEERCQQGQRFKAVMAVYNYGNPMDMDRLMAMSAKYKFYVIEDACEALLASYDNKPLGGIGHVGVFSFYGNKLVAAGEGGMVVTNNPEWFECMKLIRGQGQDPNRRFWHITPGWNFRMTNVQAAIINSQLKRLDKIAARKKEILNRYRDHLNADLIWQEVPNKGVHSYWMISVRSWEPDWHNRASKYLAEKGIETRPIFPPIHQMPAVPWANDEGSPNKPHHPNAEWLYNSGITLPSGPALTDEEVDYICRSVGETV